MTDLQSLAKHHLMLHFTDMAAYAERPIPIIERGEGCHVYDDDGRRYIDGLSGLYCVNLGHSHGDEIGRAAHEQMRTLPFTSNWTVAHPRSIELAARLGRARPARPRPGLLHLGRLGGGRVGLEARRPVAPGERRARAPQGDRPPRRLPRGDARGALVHRDPGLPRPVRAARRSRSATSSNTNAYRHPEGDDPRRFCARAAGRSRGGDRATRGRRRSRC